MQLCRDPSVDNLYLKRPTINKNIKGLGGEAKKQIEISLTTPLSGWLSWIKIISLVLPNSSSTPLLPGFMKFSAIIFWYHLRLLMMISLSSNMLYMLTLCWVLQRDKGR